MKKSEFKKLIKTNEGLEIVSKHFISLAVIKYRKLSIVAKEGLLTEFLLSDMIETPTGENILLLDKVPTTTVILPTLEVVTPPAEKFELPIHMYASYTATIDIPSLMKSKETLAKVFLSLITDLATYENNKIKKMKEKAKELNKNFEVGLVKFEGSPLRFWCSYDASANTFSWAYNTVHNSIILMEI